MAAGLQSTLLPSPLTRGYAGDKVKLLRIEPPTDDSVCDFSVEDEYAVEPLLAVRCRPQSDVR